jgi:hypothetical protein
VRRAGRIHLQRIDASPLAEVAPAIR